MKWPTLKRSPQYAVERVAPVLRDKPKFRNATLEDPNTNLENPAAWLTAALGGGGPSYSGKVVTPATAMRNSAVFRCVALKSGVIASLGIKIYKHTDKGREEAKNHKLYSLLHDEPNNLMSAYIWKEMIVSNLMLNGDHLSVIEYDNAARVIGFLPVLPGSYEVKRVKGRNKYEFRLSGGKVDVLDQDDVLHVPGLGFDGLKGMSPIAWAGRQPIGLAIAMEEFVGKMHANSIRPSGVVEADRMSPESFARLKAEFGEGHDGTGSTGRTIFLDKGMKWTQMQMTLADAQTLEHRRFSIQDIGRVFGVPPHLLGETEKQTSWGSGIEQMTIGFFIFNLSAELSRIEGELNRKLFSWPYYCEFNRDELRAMDAAAQATMFQSAINSAQMTPNEVRRRRNLPDMPGGDTLYIQSGTVPLLQTGAAPVDPAAPKPPAPADPNAPPAPAKPPAPKPAPPAKPNKTDNGDDETGDTPPAGDAVSLDDLKVHFDAYATGVRSGAITPQIEDEEYFRKQTGLPSVSTRVQAIWDAEPSRRPITLAQAGIKADPTGGNVPAAEPSTDDEPPAS